jgi:hypothetical protein
MHAHSLFLKCHTRFKNGNYSGCFCCLRKEGAAIEGAAQIFEDWEAVFAQG